jgi:hypothetical protein
MSDLTHVLFTSELAADETSACVSDIVHTARRNNAASGITGILIFDGNHFCELVEGGLHELTALTRRIRHDVRHSNFRVLAEGPSRRRRFSDWNIAYWMDDTRLLDRVFEHHVGSDALKLLDRVLPALDDLKNAC